MNLKFSKILFSCLFLIGCIRADKYNQVQVINNEFIDKIELSQKELNIQVGEEVLLYDINTLRYFHGQGNMISVTHYPNTLSTPEYNWMTYNPSVAVVNDNNKLIGIHPGKTLLIVKIKGINKESYCLIKVNY